MGNRLAANTESFTAKHTVLFPLSPKNSLMKQNFRTHQDLLLIGQNLKLGFDTQYRNLNSTHLV